MQDSTRVEREKGPKEKRVLERAQRVLPPCLRNFMESGIEAPMVIRFVLHSTPVQVAMRRTSNRETGVARASTSVPNPGANSPMHFMSTGPSEVELVLPPGIGPASMWGRCGC